MFGCFEAGKLYGISSLKGSDWADALRESLYLAGRRIKALMQKAATADEWLKHQSSLKDEMDIGAANGAAKGELFMEKFFSQLKVEPESFVFVRASSPRYRGDVLLNVLMKLDGLDMRIWKGSNEGWQMEQIKADWLLNKVKEDALRFNALPGWTYTEGVWRHDRLIAFKLLLKTVSADS